MAHIAFLLENLVNYSTQKIMVTIANELHSRGHKIDLLVCHYCGPLIHRSFRKSTSHRD